MLERPAAGGRTTASASSRASGCIQAAPDIFLGWGRLQRGDGPTVDFYVRQLRDMKGSVDVVPEASPPGGR